MIYLSQLQNGKQTRTPVEAPAFRKEADVIVCGLGTAGSLAALFCAQDGLSVVGIEAFTCLGGVHTAGGVGHHYFGLPGGRYEALEQEIRDFSQRYTCTSSQGRLLYLEQTLAQAQVDVHYESTVCGVYLEDNTVIGVQVLTPEGICDYGAKLVMDCTADAYVAVIAGCETEKGRSSDGQTQPFSIVSMVHTGETYRYTNVDYGRVDQYDDESLSRAILFSRSYSIPEGHANTRLIAQMPALGLREGRRILSREQVRIEDVLHDRQTATPIFYAYADLDKHGWDIAFDGEKLGDWAIGANLGAFNVTVAVPYRALLPREIDGLLVPCRALGVDRDVSSCVRMLPDMKKAAQAAAALASLSIRLDVTPEAVPYEALRAKLQEDGCLCQKPSCTYRIDGRKNWDGTPLTSADVHWLTEPEQLSQVLKTEQPGIAIWSAMQMGQSAVPTLQKLLESPDQNTAKHAAFALASLGSRDGVPLLRQMAAQRDGLLLTDCRKNNNLRGCMAIYWLGRLGDRQITDTLLRLICDPEEIRHPVYSNTDLKTTRYDITGFQGVYFQFMTQAAMALIRIGEAHRDLRDPIARGFAAAFSNGDYYHRITSRPPNSSEGNMVLAMKHIALAASKRWQEQ